MGDGGLCQVHHEINPLAQMNRLMFGSFHQAQGSQMRNWNRQSQQIIQGRHPDLYDQK